MFHNRSAGDADHDRAELIALMQAADFAVDWFDVKDCDIDAVLADPGELIVVAGGDGTVRRVALAASPDGPAIAILPLGTANNIAHSLGVKASIQELIAGWRKPRIKKFHPIEMDAPWGRQRLIEGIGFGVLADVMERKSAEGKPSPLEARMQLADAMRQREPEEFDIRADDARLGGAALLVEVTTIPLVGPNLYLAPDAEPADQLIDLCRVTAADRQAVVAWLATPDSAAPIPAPGVSASHIAISGRFKGVRIDDTVRDQSGAGFGTITLASATKPLRFVVPR